MCKRHPYFPHISILDESEVWSFMQLVGQGPTRHKPSLRGPLCHIAIGIRQGTLKLGGLKQQLFFFFYKSMNHLGGFTDLSGLIYASSVSLRVG